jgi:hypothetical protein
MDLLASNYRTTWLDYSLGESLNFGEGTGRPGIYEHCRFPLSSDHKGLPARDLAGNKGGPIWTLGQDFFLTLNPCGLLRFGQHLWDVPNYLAGRSLPIRRSSNETIKRRSKTTFYFVFIRYIQIQVLFSCKREEMPIS